MSSHVYHEIFLHLNWHTKDDRPLLRGEVETHCHRAIEEKCRLLRGVQLRGLGGTDTHVHVAIAIEPLVTISDIVQEIKGYSAFETNRRMKNKAVEWQRGYGVVSFGKANMEWVLAYIANQRAHHATGKVESRLETFDSPNDRKPAEAG